MPTYYRSLLTASINADTSNNMSATHHWADLQDTIDPADVVTEIIARLDLAYQEIDGAMPGGVGVPDVKVYAMADPEPRYPIGSGSLPNFNSVGVTQLPLEVAICCSFRGEYQSGVNRQSLRGRTYLGPWSTNASDGGGALLPARVSVATLAAIDGWAEKMFAPVGEPLTWVVYSPTRSLYTAVTHYAVNNEFDTMRSRQTDRPMLVWTDLAP